MRNKAQVISLLYSLIYGKHRKRLFTVSMREQQRHPLFAMTEINKLVKQLTHYHNYYPFSVDQEPCGC